MLQILPNDPLRLPASLQLLPSMPHSLKGLEHPYHQVRISLLVPNCSEAVALWFAPYCRLTWMEALTTFVVYDMSALSSSSHHQKNVYDLFTLKYDTVYKAGHGCRDGQTYFDCEVFWSMELSVVPNVYAYFVHLLLSNDNKTRNQSSFFSDFDLSLQNMAL